MTPEEKKVAVGEFIAAHECTIEDKVYGEVDGVELLSTIYTPKIKSSEPTRAIVYVHGGGFVGGDRTHFNVHGAYFASKGVVGMCINYRLVPSAKFPAQVNDANCAVRWLRKNAGEFNIDPEQIYICGSSAGGHIAGLVAYANEVKEFELTGGSEGVSSQVAGAVLYCAYLEPVPNEKVPRKDKDNLTNYFGGTIDDVPSIYQKGSVRTYVNEKSVRALMFHGDADGTVCIGNSICLQEAFEKNKVDSELEVLPGGGHKDYDFECPAYMITLRKMEEFIFAK